jgi:hypothetical protein
VDSSNDMFGHPVALSGSFDICGLDRRKHLAYLSGMVGALALLAVMIVGPLVFVLALKLLLLPIQFGEWLIELFQRTTF